MSTLKCTTRNLDNSDCPRPVARIVAWPIDGSMFVAPYCEEHAADIEVDMGGQRAVGPGLAAMAKTAT